MIPLRTCSFSRSSALLCAMVAATLGRAQEPLTWIQLDATGSGTVWITDEASPSQAPTTFLQDVRILPIDRTMRTPLGELDPDAPRVVQRLGLPSIECPDGTRLLHYRRGTNRFGFLAIRPSGEPLVVHERNGVGVGNAVDPFAPAVGVSPDGTYAAISADTQLVIARLDGQVFASSGTPSRVVALTPGDTLETTSLAPGATHCFFVTDFERVWRCPLADGGTPQDITPVVADPTAEPDDELAMSGDGEKVVFLYGPRDLERLWMVGPSGPATVLPPPPAKYEEAGYLPDVADGPHILLDDDGSHLMYTDSTSREEVYLLDTTGASPTLHVTSDANFEPYIGITILPSFAANALLVAVGDPAAHDWFEASTTAATLPVRNVTGTGPTLVPPFDTGTLAPLAGSRTESGALVSVESMVASPSQFRIRTVDPIAGTTWTAARSLRDLPRLGTSAGSAPPRVRIAAFDGDLLLDPGTGTPALAGPAGIRLSTESTHASGLFSLFVARIQAGGAEGAAIFMHVFQPGGTPTVLPLLATRSVHQALMTPRERLIVVSTDPSGVRHARQFGDNGTADLGLSLTGSLPICLSGSTM